MRASLIWRRRRRLLRRSSSSSLLKIKNEVTLKMCVFVWDQLVAETLIKLCVYLMSCIIIIWTTCGAEKKTEQYYGFEQR